MSIWVGRDRANGSCGGEGRGSCDERVKGARAGDSIPVALKRALDRQVSGIYVKTETAMFVLASFADRIKVIGQSTQAPGGALVETSQHVLSCPLRRVGAVQRS